MPESTARKKLIHRLREAAEQDERIVGMLDYGSSSEGRVDEWSDIDVAMFIRDTNYEAFTSNWKEWVAQFGDLLLAYIGWVGHPWTIYAAESVPLRVDFDLHRQSEIPGIPSWPNSPLSVEAMVWCDKTKGLLSAYVQQLVGKFLRLENQAASFDQECGDFWYFLLYVFCKLQRGQQWNAREVFHREVMAHLLALLRLEADALDRWESAPRAWNIEHSLSPERLAQLDECIPTVGEAGLRQALYAAARLGQEVCEVIAIGHGWAWPQILAEQMVMIMAFPGEQKMSSQESVYKDFG